jgi:DNA replication protein DnaC
VSGATSTMTAKLIEAGVPQRIAGFRPGDSRSPQWSGVYSRLREKVGTGCLYCLCGDRGSGKSTLGACLVGRAIEAGRHAKFIDAPTLLMNLRATLGENAVETEGEVLRRYVQPDFLVINEVRLATVSDFESRAVEHIIAKRYDAGDRDTILITILTAADLASALGTEIAARVGSSGGIVECTWGSLRVPEHDLGLEGRA